MCGRAGEELTRHHLIPRTRHKNKKNKRDFSRSEMQGRVIMICRPCHKNVHAVLTEKELEAGYNTLERLAAHPGVRKFTDWVKTKPAGAAVRVRESKKKRRG